jgi:hypothetical protein
MASLNEEWKIDDEFNHLLDKDYVVNFMDYTYKNYIFKLNLNDNSIPKTYLLKISEVTTNESSTNTHIDSLINEAEKQIDIYNKTISQPLCPKIFYHGIVSIGHIKKLSQHTDNANNKSYFDSLMSYLINYNESGGGGNNSFSSNGTAPFVNNNSNSNTAPYVPNNESEFYSLNNNNVFFNDDKMIYVICMEYLDNYTNLNSLPRPIIETFYNELIIQAFQIIIELLIETGYVHGDFHINNILYNIQDDTNFYKGIDKHKPPISNSNFLVSLPKLRPILIDFGDSYKLTSKEMIVIKNMKKEKNYTGIIDYMCKDTKSRRNLSRIIYEYICRNNLDKKLVNKKIDQYFEMRDHNIKEFDFYSTKKNNNNLTSKSSHKSSSSQGRSSSRGRKSRSRTRSSSSRGRSSSRAAAASSL